MWKWFRRDLKFNCVSMINLFSILEINTSANLVNVWMCEHNFAPNNRYFLYSFTGLSNGAWLVSNTHSSRLIDISSSTKREQHFDGPVDVCKSSNKRTRTWMRMEREEEIVAQKTWMWSIKLRGAVFRLQIHAINTCRSSADQDIFNERRTGATFAVEIHYSWHYII